MPRPLHEPMIVGRLCRRCGSNLRYYRGNCVKCSAARVAKLAHTRAVAAEARDHALVAHLDSFLSFRTSVSAEELAAECPDAIRAAGSFWSLVCRVSRHLRHVGMVRNGGRLKRWTWPADAINQARPATIDQPRNGYSGTVQHTAAGADSPRIDCVARAEQEGGPVPK